MDQKLQRLVLRALLPALHELYGRDGWQTEPTRDSLGDVFIAPDGTRLGKLSSNKNTAALLRLLNGEKGRWAPEEVIEWAAQAVLAKLAKASQRDMLGQHWTTEEEGDKLTFKSPSGLLVAKELPADLDTEFRALMRMYASNLTEYWFRFDA